MPGHTERDFETAIEAGLTSGGGYRKRRPNSFDEARALFPDDIVDFLKDSQPAKWESLRTLLGPKTAATVLDGLSKELDFKGTLHVLRHGFKCYGKTLRMAYFRPNTTMNPEAARNYAKNRLTITRQVSFISVMKKADGKNRRCVIDVTLAVNGIPVVTAELKNPLTGQRAAHAVAQYKDDRDGRDLLFAFKRRALVHFAVDPDEVWMTTRLRGKETHFLPFNRGNDHGAGNPPVEGNWKSHYLWDEVLQADSLLEILQRFMHLEVKEKQVKIDGRVRTERKEKMIFPRYHQLDAVRKLVAHAKANGAGRNYLIQHSAGSGKSNSIAWLSHRLASLHDKHDEKVFHSVIVVTDRRVLDQQLQETIYQFEHKAGVVEKIDEDTRQLAQALSDGTPIVITTIQKFPFISQALSTLEKKGAGVEIDTAGKRFAVIVDEAHSSQSGETATALRGMLNKAGIEAAIAAQLSDEEDDDLSDDAKAAVLRHALQRARQPNLSFFAFTATPKFKTKALFGEPGPSGASPFHEYSMRQAIEEGFVMDVLQNYTTYKRFFGLIKQVEDDPDVPRRKTATALTRYLELHPVNIEQVVAVVVEHFRLHVMYELGGRAKAMVVTGSRLAAVRYKLAFDRYIADQGYAGIRSLVAFSGTVEDPDDPGSSYTEVAMNDGLAERALPEAFRRDDYRVLLVAEKYQTGFDQPLLQTMYVVKRLDPAGGVTGPLGRIVARLRQEWPWLKILLRADSAYARDELMTWCKDNDVDYVIGLAKNSRLVERIGWELADAAAEAERKGRPARRFAEFPYATLTSWSCQRRVIAKAEHLTDKSNPRFVVTSLPADTFSARTVYERLYCARGNMENTIKEQQLDLFSDRTSATCFAANQLRLLFSAFASILFSAIRQALHGTQLARATAGTLRLKLLKIGARVMVSVRRVKVAMDSAHPSAAAFARVHARLPG